MRPFRQPLLGHVLKRLILFPGRGRASESAQPELSVAREGGSQCPRCRGSWAGVPGHQPGALFPGQLWQSRPPPAEPGPPEPWGWGSPGACAMCRLPGLPELSSGAEPPQRRPLAVVASLSSASCKHPTGARAPWARSCRSPALLPGRGRGIRRASNAIISPWSSSERCERRQSLLVAEGAWAMSVHLSLALPGAAATPRWVSLGSCPRRGWQRDGGHGLHCGSPHSPWCLCRGQQLRRVLARLRIYRTNHIKLFLLQSFRIQERGFIRRFQKRSALCSSAAAVRSSRDRCASLLPRPRPHPCLPSHWSGFFPSGRGFCSRCLSPGKGPAWAAWLEARGSPVPSARRRSSASSNAGPSAVRGFMETSQRPN